jgi:integrase
MSGAVSIRPVSAAEAADAFLSFLRRNDRSAKTLRRYRPILAEFAEWAGERRLSSVTAEEIDTFIKAWWAERFEARNGREPSAQSKRAVHTVLSSLYGYLVDFAVLVDEGGRAVPNPMPKVPRPRIVRRRNDWLRSGEDAALLEAPMDLHERVLVYLLRWTGLRLSEALALRIRDVDLIERTIYVNDSKTENGIREVPIAPELVPSIKAWLAHLDAKGLNRSGGYLLCTTRVGRWKDRATGRVLTSEPGSPMKPQQVEKIVRRVGERAGIERLTPHRLRRTFGSYFLNRGVRMESVSNLLGHADTRITQQAYASLLPSTVRDEMLAALGA